MTMTVAPDGSIRCLYTEALDLPAIGSCRIQRASNVNPDETGKWWADIVDGPLLGPFPTRSAALTAEIEWLEENIL